MLVYLVLAIVAVAIASMNASRALLMQRSTTLWQAYCSQLKKRPLLTKAATGVVGSLIGDGIAQLSSNRSSRTTGFSWEAARATRLCVYAAVIGTPIGHYWFHFLDKFIFPNHMGHPMTAIVKTLLDQVLMAPAGIGVFFVCMGMLEGQSLSQAWQSTKEKFKPTLMANYMLWPAANLVNFAFVPPAQRILYCNVIYIFWASFLSAMASKKTEGQQFHIDPALAQKEL